MKKTAKPDKFKEAIETVLGGKLLLNAGDSGIEVTTRSGAKATFEGMARSEDRKFVFFTIRVEASEDLVNPVLTLELDDEEGDEIVEGLRKLATMMPTKESREEVEDALADFLQHGTIRKERLEHALKYAKELKAMDKWKRRREQEVLDSVKVPEGADQRVEGVPLNELID